MALDILGAISSIGGALIQGKGQGDTNAANAQEAQRNREFQERMRGSQYQTAVEDMRKAGLNPALAYQQGGAGTPSGGQAQFQNPAAGAAASAAQAFSTFQEMRRTAAEIDKTQAETANLDQLRTIMGVDFNLKTLDHIQRKETINDVIARVRNESKTSASTAREASASAKIRELGIPEAEAIAGFYRSIVGKASPYLNSGASVLRGLSGLRKPAARTGTRTRETRSGKGWSSSRETFNQM